MADNSSPDYRLRLKRLEERYGQEKFRAKADRGAREAGIRKETTGRRAKLTDLVHRAPPALPWPSFPPVESRDTISLNTDKVPLHIGKYCPTRSEPWMDCPEQLLSNYRSVYQYLESNSEQAPRLSLSLPELEGLGRRFSRKPLSSEQDLEAYERFGVEEHVHDIITELCKFPAACDEFGLGDGIQLINHTNSLSRSEPLETDPIEQSSILHPRPDQFCIHLAMITQIPS